ncbi:Erv1 / Alr family [Fragilaria crotonensis]|nr:Erv1 / Alr family [Fragilaria crotonensis]
MVKKRNELDCLDRFHIVLMTLTFGLAVPFLIIHSALGYGPFAFGPKYLYSVMPPADYWPVIEYQTSEVKTTQENYVPPVFLTSKSTTNRVVEFYAPWCPHCQHFKQSYINLARNCTAMAKRYGVEIDFYAVSCTANPDVCKAENLHAFPLIKLYGARNGTGTQVEAWRAHCFTALKYFGVDLPDELDQPDVAIPVVRERVDETVKHVHDTRTKKQIFDDAFLSFEFAMRNSIYMSNGPLSNESAAAFAKWIELLENTLPPTWKLHNALDSLSKHIEEVIQNESKLVAIVNEHGPTTKRWSPGCPAGYTCGLWELFHIMSIGMVEWNKMSFSENAVFTAESTADTLHDYITEFLACDVCRRHFVADFDACTHDRCNRLGSSTTDPEEWKQFPLWLWEVHNDVRVRLLHEKAERENRKASKAEEIAAQWPSRDDCPACWLSDGSWDDEVIYKYLRITYWTEDSVSASYRRDLERHNQKKLEKLRGDNDDDDEKSQPFLPFFAFQFVGGAVVLIAVACIQKKVERDRTGRHKKVDTST